MRGLNLWALTLVPSLLPFIILSNILLHTNFIHIFGRLLNPIMRPLFHMSGNCAFALALGFTSGFPMGAIAAASLYEQKLCTKEEAARLLAFTNNSSPLFLLAAVPITMLHSPELGLLLLLSHYSANFLIGIILGLFSRIKKEQPLTLSYQQIPPSPPFIQLFTQAITHGVKSILNIGGFVIFFSVIVSLGESIGLFDFLTLFFTSLLPFDPIS
ncbi:MAG: sporulation integral membrane protein YlbJ, partial [Clostridia bacterium]|nr:sporulation integral membrane protein YlbJ [Clostridia bacterium]